MITALAVLWAIAATVASYVYFQGGRRLDRELATTVKAADNIIGHMRQSNADLAGENARLTHALKTIHETITRRPPRRRWLRICHQVARKAAAGREW